MFEPIKINELKKAKKKEAIEFAEWLAKEEWKHLGDNKWRRGLHPLIRKEKTTEELYDEFHSDFQSKFQKEYK